MPEVDITVPANVFTTPRDLTVNQLQNPTAACPGGYGLYLDITGGADEVLSDWVTITIHGVATAPTPLAVYRYVPPSSPTGVGTWTHDYIRGESYDPAAHTLTFQTKHFSSFGAGTAASTGGGGGGGCSISPGGEPDFLLLLLPLAAMGISCAARVTRRRRPANH
jgi:hypothetical protein